MKPPQIHISLQQKRRAAGGLSEIPSLLNTVTFDLVFLPSSLFIRRIVVSTVNPNKQRYELNVLSCFAPIA